MKMYETASLYLTPLTKEIAYNSNYQNWFHNPDVTRYNSHGVAPYTRKKMDKFFNALDDTDDVVFAIMCEKAIEIKVLGIPQPNITNVHIGNVSLQSINWINRTAEFAILIGEKDYWGRGCGCVAGEFMLEHGFAKLNLHRIWAGTAKTNTGMLKLMKKLNMIYDGRFREGLYLNNKYQDIHIYSILENEWRKVK